MLSITAHHMETCHECEAYMNIVLKVNFTDLGNVLVIRCFFEEKSKIKSLCYVMLKLLQFKDTTYCSVLSDHINLNEHSMAVTMYS